jgi:hypothetical protein
MNTLEKGVDMPISPWQNRVNSKVILPHDEEEKERFYITSRN